LFAFIDIAFKADIAPEVGFGSIVLKNSAGAGLQQSNGPGVDYLTIW